MSTWEFLRPWSDVLYQFGAVDVISLYWDQDASHDSLLRPIGPIEITLPVEISSQTVRRLRQAIELVGYALLIEPQLWGTVRCVPKRFVSREQKPSRFVDPTAFRDDDRKPLFVFVWDRRSPEMRPFSRWIDRVAELLQSDVDEEEDESYANAWQHLQELDVFDVAPVGKHRVPVSFSVQLVIDDADALAAMLETISPTVLQIAHADVCIGEVDDAMCRALDRIRAKGIPIRRARVTRKLTFVAPSSQRLFMFASPLSSFSQSLRTLVTPASSPVRPLQSLYYQFSHARPHTAGQCAALLNGPTTIQITMLPQEEPDWLLLCRALQLSALTSPERHLDLALPNFRPRTLAHALRTMHQANPNTLVRANALNTAGVQALEQLAAHSIDGSSPIPAIVGSKHVLLLLPNGGELLDVPRASVVMADDAVPPDGSVPHAPIVTGSVSARLQFGVCLSAGLRTLTALLATCFGDRLTSLDVEIVVDAAFSARTIASILAAFPSLTCLKLSPTKLKTMDVFLDAYRDERCQLRVLSITSGGIGFVPFFEELTSPDAAITRRLEQLKLNYPEKDGPHADVFLRALSMMLAHNNHLQVLELVVSTKSEPLIEKIAVVLRPFQNRPIAIASHSGMPMKAKLAVLGALTSEHGGRGRAAKASRTRTLSERRTSLRRCLDRGLLELLLAFAAPCETRVIRLVHERSRSVGYGKVTGGCMTFASVDQDIFRL